MQTLALILHAKPGMAADLKNLIELVQGPAEPGWERELVGQGIVTNTVWHSPEDNIFVLIVEAEDPERAFFAMQTSDNPVARWVRDTVTSATGFDPTTMKPLELLYDWKAPGSSS